MDRYQRDVLWLGEEEALLGPAVRAALGILIERDDWTWWDDPSKALYSLQGAVPRHSPVRWGGDSSVMDADQWVDPQRALRLGRAFCDLLWQGSLKIKVVRTVWGWPDGAETVGVVTLDMSKLVGPGHVFPEWERNARPRFPIVPRSQQGLPIVTSLNPFLYERIGAVQEYIDWRPDASIADIVIADSIDALYTIEAARLVILYGQFVETELALISRLRDDLCAQCVVRVDTDETSIANWLRYMMTSWAEWGETFANAIEMAETETGLRTLVLSSTQSFLLGRDTFSGLTAVEEASRSSNEYRLVVGRDGPPSRVSDLSSADSALVGQGGSDDSESNRRAPPSGVTDSTGDAHPRFDAPVTFRELPTIQGRRPIVARPAPPVERVLNARTRQGMQEIGEWPRYGVVDIDIEIQVKTPLRDREDRPSFPDDRVEWEGAKKVLQVHMFEFGREPKSQTLELSRTGSSTAATFTRDGGIAPVDLRFMVSDDARILQTARLQAVPGEKIRFFIENIVTPVHRTKAAFDVALLMNDSLGNQPSVAVISGNGEVVFCPLSENGIGCARDDLLRTLEQAVVNPNALLSPLMLELANSGAVLLKHLRSIVPTWPGSEGRIQLVTQSEVFFPIEYLYDGKVPESPDAALCTESGRCLKQGKAITGCPIREAGEQLCPMGFMGVSGVVERHTWKAGQDPRLWGAPGGHNPKRHRIEDLSSIAFAASDKADDFADTDLQHHEIVRIASIEQSLGVKKISTWSGWKAQLAQHSPTMLLMLVHLEKKAVYVGAKEGLNLGAIDVQHVGNAPVVIAIGCSTGLADIPGGSLPAILQINGARVVVAAMTGVLGRHANRVARDLAIHIKEAAVASRSTFIGEIISAVRRQLLADGLALGLAVVAFGDADIVLGKERTQG